MALTMKQRYGKLDLTKLPDNLSVEFTGMKKDTENFSDPDLVEIEQENFDLAWGIVEKNHPEAIKGKKKIKKVKPSKKKGIKAKFKVGDVIKDRNGKDLKVKKMAGKYPLARDATGKVWVYDKDRDGWYHSYKADVMPSGKTELNLVEDLIDKELKSAKEWRKSVKKPAKTEKLKGYAKSISEATGVTDKAKLEEIEDIMRNVVFHSTLDWQSKEEFNKGAKKALDIIDFGKPKGKVKAKAKKKAKPKAKFKVGDVIKPEAKAKYITKVYVMPTNTGFKKYGDRLKKYGIPKSKFLDHPLTYVLPEDKALAAAYTQIVIGSTNFDEYSKHLSKVKTKKSKFGGTFKYISESDDILFKTRSTKVKPKAKKKDEPKPTKKAEPDNIAECKKIFKEAGYTVKKQIIKKKRVTKRVKRPDKAIIKEDVSKAVTTIAKDTVKSKEDRQKYADSLKTLNSIKKLLTSILQSIDKLYNDNDADKLKKIEGLLKELTTNESKIEKPAKEKKKSFKSEVEKEKEKVKKRLVKDYGTVLTTDELQKKYEVISFSAPFVTVKRKSDGVKGTMQFTHSPRFYVSFIAHE